MSPSEEKFDDTISVKPIKPVKLIDDLTDDDIEKMGKETFDAYEGQALADINRLSMTIVANTDRFHEMCVLAKRHGPDYMQYQTEAYSLRANSKQGYTEIKQISGKLLKLKRKWENATGKNNVHRLLKTEKGTYILSKS